MQSYSNNLDQDLNAQLTGMNKFHSKILSFNHKVEAYNGMIDGRNFLINQLKMI